MPDLTTEQINEMILKGKAAVRVDDYLLALNTFSELYADGFREAAVEGLSYYGVSVAMVTKKYRDAIDLCQKAIKLQFMNPNHYVNLARVYAAAGHKKKAIATLEQGLRVLPRHRVITTYWRELGVRSRPPIPFLSRENPLNVAIGRWRYQKKLESEKRRKD